MDTQPSTAYGRAAAGVVYDLLNSAIWLPAGSGRLRQRLVDVLDPQPGERVLELGCGTGQVTARLLRRGARVVAVDRSDPMLARARRRAAGAELLAADVLDWDAQDRFDAVVCAFLLHELPTARRRQVLGVAASSLHPGGRLALLEWALPRGRLRRLAWRTFVRALEPPPAVEVLDGALHKDLADGGWVETARKPLAGGRAEVLIATVDVPARRAGPHG